MESYGAKIRRIRGSQSPRAFARRLGITAAALSAYETGKRLPRDEVKLRIAAAAGKEQQNFLRKECTNSAQRWRRWK